MQFRGEITWILAEGRQRDKKQLGSEGEGLLREIQFQGSSGNDFSAKSTPQNQVRGKGISCLGMQGDKVLRRNPL